MHTLDLTYVAHGGNHQRVPVIAPGSTSVKAINEASQALLDAHVEFVTISRERTAAQGDPVRYAEDARISAAEAGQKGGDAGEAKKLKKKARAAEERLGDLDLEWEVAIANLQAKRWAYAEAVEHNAPALAAEGRTDADAAILSLASASGIARKAEVQLSNTLAILSALSRVREGGEFAPTPPRAQSGGMGGAPGPYIGEGIGHLSTAIGYATEILDEIKSDEKAADQRAKLEAEADDAPDLDDDDDDEVEA